MRSVKFFIGIVFIVFSGRLYAQNSFDIDKINTGKDLKTFMNPDEYIVVHFLSNDYIGQLDDFIYLGDNWVVMKWENIHAHDMIHKGNFDQIGKLKPKSKLSEIFRSDYDIERKYNANDKISVYLHFWGNLTEVESEMLNRGIQVLEIDESGKFLSIQANKKQIESLTELNYVSFVEPITESRTPLLSNARPLVNVVSVQNDLPKGLGIQGEGMKIGVWDYGMTGFNRDIEGQFQNVDQTFFNNGGSQHTTMVTGAIASKGILREESIGMAPKSKVYIYDFFGNILREIKNAKDNYGVYATNHSYNLGAAYKCFFDYGYSTASAQIDRFALDEPKIVNVFAAGNSAVACAYDYKTIVPGFQYGKNVITVGNLQNNETFYPGSAKGPTNDGRLKPDVMAKGSSSFVPTLGIILPSPTDNFTYGYGTSFSSPIVTGIVSLMQEAYLENHGTIPLSTTVRAILCNTAKDIGNPGPDYDYGFGKVDAYQAVKSIQQDLWIEDSVQNQEEKDFIVPIPNNILEAKFLITWNDLPTSLPYDQVLVNDIDFKVENPSGSTVLPLVLNPYNPSAVAIQGVDSLNNTEQIVIKNPAPGNYTLKVFGEKIISEHQSFSISYWMDDQEFVWNYPLQNNILSSNASNYLRWRSQISDSVKIQYSLDSGTTWLEVATQYADSNYYEWVTPNGHFPKVLLRALDRDAQVLSISDTFALSPRMTIVNTKECYDNIRLSWTAIDNANKYVISQLDEKNNWNDIAESNQRIFYFNNTEKGREYIFSIRPVFGDFEGLRSNAVKILARGSGTCNFPVKDVGVTSINPSYGVVGSEIALSDTERVQIVVTSYANTLMNNVQLYYQVDDLDTQVVDVGNMNANSIFKFTSPEVYDFSAVGQYRIKAWIVCSTDVNATNDSLEKVVVQNNSVIASFPYYQDFESISDSMLYNSAASLIDIPEWDYYVDGPGRVFNFHDPSFSPSGEKSLSVDSYLDRTASENSLYLNIDLSSQPDSLVYIDFDYFQRDLTGNDTLFFKETMSDDWIPIFSMYNISSYNGTLIRKKRINLSKIVFQSGHSFSNHSILKWKFANDRTAVNISSYGGYTLDDLKIYNGSLDLSLEKIDIPNVNCVTDRNSSQSLPLKLRILNNSPLLAPAGNVSVTVKLNGILVANELIDKDIHPFEEITYQLKDSIDFQGSTAYTLDAEIDYSKDEITDNNAIHNYHVNFLDAIGQLPFDVNFDSDTEFQFIPEGDEYSWELGKPNKAYLYNVPDNPGKSWVTKLNGMYNDNEFSYLYVGCFDPQLLTYDSELSFLMLYNTEFDADYMFLEYSFDGGNWYKFGSTQTGYNWYTLENVYNDWEGDRLYWQVASIPLTPFFGDIRPHLFFRFNFKSNEYIQMEGVGLDNFRINTNLKAVISDSSIVASGNSHGSGKVELSNNNIVYATLDDQGQNLGQISLEISVDSTMPTYRDKFLVPRYYRILTENNPTSPYKLTLFEKNEEYMRAILSDRNIRRMGELGCLVYDGLNTDSLYTNNHFDENYTFYHPDSIEFWPYKNGYELRLSLDKSNAEIYLTSNLSDNNAYPFVAITQLNVYRNDTSNNTFIDWVTSKEDSVVQYVVQHSIDGVHFVNVDSVDVHGAFELYHFEDANNNFTGQHYYRIIAVADSQTYTSLIDSLSFEYEPTSIVNTSTSLSNNFQVDYLQNGWVNVHWGVESNSQYDIRLIDLSGRVLESRKSAMQTGVNRMYFEPLKNAASGMYFIQILQGKDSKSGKFIKSE